MLSSEEHKDFSNKNNFEFEYLPIKARSTLRRGRRIFTIIFKDKYPFLSEGQKFLRKESQNEVLPKKILGLQRRRVILLIKLVLNVRFCCNESNNTSFKVGNVSFQNTFN